MQKSRFRVQWWLHDSLRRIRVRSGALPVLLRGNPTKGTRTSLEKAPRTVSLNVYRGYTVK